MIFTVSVIRCRNIRVRCVHSICRYPAYSSLKRRVKRKVIQAFFLKGMGTSLYGYYKRNFGKNNEILKLIS